MDRIHSFVAVTAVVALLTFASSAEAFLRTVSSKPNPGVEWGFWTGVIVLLFSIAWVVFGLACRASGWIALLGGLSIFLAGGLGIKFPKHVDSVVSTFVFLGTLTLLVFGGYLHAASKQARRDL